MTLPEGLQFAYVTSTCKITNLGMRLLALG